MLLGLAGHQLTHCIVIADKLVQSLFRVHWCKPALPQSNDGGPGQPYSAPDQST